MKKQHIIFTFLAAVAVLGAVSCQKDQDFVTLNAVIQKANNDSKVFINDYTPYWHNGDQIHINGDTYTLQAAMENSAQIPNVTSSTSGYRAIFPAGIMTNPTANINSNGSVPVTMTATQNFEMVGDYQRVDVPMGAYISSGSTLQFHNLCSIVRVIVSNGINAELPVQSITLTADNAYLSGPGTATITGNNNTDPDAIAITPASGSHSVTLSKTDNSTMKTIQPLVSESFDIIVPEFSDQNDVTITVNAPTGYSSTTIEDVSLSHNTITTVTVNVNALTPHPIANLVNGSTFNAAIPSNTRDIRFEYNNTDVTSGTLLSTDDSPMPIYGNLESSTFGYTWVVSTAAGTIMANANCRSMFQKRYSYTYLTSIDFGSGFNTSNVTDMFNMFYECSSLANLDLSCFNTSNVTNMINLFYGCSNLTSVNLSSFNTSNVTTMADMFQGCSRLSSLDLSNFNTSNVTDISYMFADCTILNSIDISSFNTSNVTTMGGLFSGCSGLTSIDLSNFITSNVTRMPYMFRDCSNLTSLNLSNFSTANVNAMEGMFSGCSRLTSLNLSNFNTANVTKMNGMFLNCNRLNSLSISNFNTANVTDMAGMFSGCSSLTSLNLSNFNTTSVTNMQGMFKNCSGLTYLNLYNFDMSNLGYEYYYWWQSGGDNQQHPSKYDMCNGLAPSSGGCHIYCSTAVQTQLQNGTSLDNSRITWHTH